MCIQTGTAYEVARDTSPDRTMNGGPRRAERGPGTRDGATLPRWDGTWVHPAAIRITPGATAATSASGSARQT